MMIISKTAQKGDTLYVSLKSGSLKIDKKKKTSVKSKKEKALKK